MWPGFHNAINPQIPHIIMTTASDSKGLLPYFYHNYNLRQLVLVFVAHLLYNSVRPSVRQSHWLNS